MQSSIAISLDALATWRAELDRHIAQLGRTLSEHDLLDSADSALLQGLRDRLATDKLVLAFVAEYSRGKSELINAIFFADAGRRVLPATPGRTTMCPVELRYDADTPPRLSLLPVETRLRGASLAELRRRDEPWHHVVLDPKSGQSLVDALAAVTRTQRVAKARAVALGFWDESQPEDNPPADEDGFVEVPTWRHAIINYPHPLLQRGLVVIDTPGLNAIGAEPELTLGLLPSAHAVVFVLAADTGVTRSDLQIWREHLGQSSLERFVVLNKIDALADPLLERAKVNEQIEQQRAHVASAFREACVDALAQYGSLIKGLSDNDSISIVVMPASTWGRRESSQGNEQVITVRVRAIRELDAGSISLEDFRGQVVVTDRLGDPIGSEQP